MKTRTDKFLQQEKEYEFPYHHIPHFDPRTGTGLISRSLGWGLEYLCYMKHIQELVDSLSPDSVLDVGCGDGRFLGMLGQEIRRKVGIDLAERAIDFARAFHPDIEFRVTDASDMSETFDVVLAIEVLEHIPDSQVSEFLQTLTERTAGKGHLIICVPTKVAPLLSKHYRHYDSDLLMQQIETASVNLKLLRTEYVYKQRGSIFHRFIEKLLQNRFWTVDVYRLRSPLWKYAWKKRRFATARDGRHLVVLFQKI
jgi:SAM-dependent methyltransferase